MSTSTPPATKESGFGKWFAASPIASFIRSFIATLITVAFADWSSDGVISFANWQSWLVAAGAAALPVLIRWLNPQDSGFGRTAQ
jgi:uncharacterized RDD family membrane protein YckC